MKEEKKKFSVKHRMFSACPYCKKQIQSESYMKSHIKNYHPEKEAEENKASDIPAVDGDLK